MRYKKYLLHQLKREKSKFFTKRLKWYKELKQFKNDTRYDNYLGNVTQLKHKHYGERCFVIGTGPSLNKTNLDLLEDEYVIGMNTLFNAYKKSKFRCDYYCVSDKANAWMHYYKDILSLDTTLFIGGWAGQEYLDNIEMYKKFEKCDSIPLRQRRSAKKGWKPDLLAGTPACHSTVSAMCLPVAYHLGFSEVYLLGIDFDYRGQHHFDGVVYGPTRGKKVNKTERCPELWGEVFKECEVIHDVFRKDERSIINCTVGGRLDLFPRIKLEDLF